MYEVSQAGAVLLPPVVSYYNHPQSVEDCTRHIVGKILDQFGIDGEDYHRWE
jgi:4-hydroxy-3-polyprenylbenzoate decarboxylase